MKLFLPPKTKKSSKNTLFKALESPFSNLLTRITLTDAKITELDFLPSMPNLLNLDVSALHLKSLSGLGEAGAFEFLAVGVNFNNVQSITALRSVAVIELKVVFQDPVELPGEGEELFSLFLIRLYSVQRKVQIAF